MKLRTFENVYNRELKKVLQSLFWYEPFDFQKNLFACASNFEAESDEFEIFQAFNFSSERLTILYLGVFDIYIGTQVWILIGVGFGTLKTHSNKL